MKNHIICYLIPGAFLLFFMFLFLGIVSLFDEDKVIQDLDKYLKEVAKIINDEI